MIDEHWRWFADTTWHYHAAMTWAMTLSCQERSEFTRYTYTRSCIYFAACALESFLNQTMRKHMQKHGESEDAIHYKLRTTPFKDKRNKWPQRILGRTISVGVSLDRALSARDEVTHPKRRDHSIYRDLDDLCLPEIVNDVSHFLVTAKQLANEPFPYWVLGWNYVNLQAGSVQVVEANNMNGFYHSAKNLQIVRDRYHDPHWDETHMNSVSSFRKLKKLLDGQECDIEPMVDYRPFAPRLTRRWWDHGFIVDAWGHE